MSAYVAVAAVVLVVQGGPDRHWILIWLLGLFALLGWRNEQPALRMLFDFLPLLAILAAYDLVRANADTLIDRAHLEPMIKFDELIGAGAAPTVRLQDALFDPRHPHWYDYLSLVVYVSHFFTAIVVGFCVYFVARARFARYALTFLVCSLAGFATYVIYPAIPPWLASERGALPPTVRAVDAIWHHLDLDFLGRVFSGDPKYSNPVGALPSEHGAYPMLFLLLFWAVASPRWRAVLVGYVLAMAFVLVYFAEHYVLDIFAGWAYAIAAFWVVGRALDWWATRRAATSREPPPRSGATPTPATSAPDGSRTETPVGVPPSPTPPPTEAPTPTPALASELGAPATRSDARTIEEVRE